MFSMLQNMRFLESRSFLFQRTPVFLQFEGSKIDCVLHDELEKAGPVVGIRAFRRLVPRSFTVLGGGAEG
jgi:hypothetical protein